MNLYELKLKEWKKLYWISILLINVMFYRVQRYFPESILAFFPSMLVQLLHKHV